MNIRTALLAATALVAVPLTSFAGDISFAPVPFAKTDAAKRQVAASASATIDGKEAAIGFRLLARSGDKIGSGTFGMLVDKDGNGVADASSGMDASPAPDFTSLLPVGDKLYSVTHFESRPGAMYLSELKQDADGMLTPVSTKPIDFTAYSGLWVPCAGSVTPWNTHLGSEEYPSDARTWEAAQSLDDISDYDKPMVRFLGVDPATMTLDDFRAAYKPYRYGYPTEVSVSADGNGTATKHFAMGRVAVELAKVMPDNKTAYITDDGTNGGLYMFVADQAGDLSAGTLYAARWRQTDGSGAGAADLDWVNLGPADDATVQKAIEGGVSFSDLFETAEIGKDGSCPEGFLASNAAAKAECLKVKPGMEAVASRVETRRFASMMGATTEFRKMEGIAYNPATNTAYLAISSIEKGMEDGAKHDKGGRNDIRLAKNKCGAVYELTLDGGYRATRATGLVTGRPSAYAEGSEYAGNSCEIDGIANPDNLTFITGHDTLIIGEDTGSGHQNDVVWAYNLTSGEMTRILTSPYGSETTSVYWYPNVGGHAYMTAVIQHPYGESDSDKIKEPADARAYVGYIGPFPAMD
ncbi:PhoX family protein [Acidimangrovimonas pyrenivorans]|uniref:PhoX family protein n=1 Tax=Acidimangrovimonas pyrenivorans TaxID=2030798 RepID=A0ABV7AEU4_9RHOB